jgi:hypothetical protein
MRELYNEDPANHVGPESCVGVPRGRSEALTGGVRAGLLSHETTYIRVPTSSLVAEGEAAGGVMRELPVDPAWSEIPGTYDKAPCTRTERSRGRPLAADDAPSWMVRGVADQRRSGREGNAEAVIPRCTTKRSQTGSYYL